MYRDVLLVVRCTVNRTVLVAVTEDRIVVVVVVVAIRYSLSVAVATDLAIAVEVSVPIFIYASAVCIQTDVTVAICVVATAAPAILDVPIAAGNIDVTVIGEVAVASLEVVTAITGVSKGGKLHPKS